MAKQPTFNELATGAAFAFAMESEVTYQGARGPWVKVGPYTYRSLVNGYAHGVTHRIGSLSAPVQKEA